jgi:hypothetical protein
MKQADKATPASVMLTPAVRRRNRRVGLLLTLVAMLAALWTPWAVSHHLLYPAEETWSFHFGK